jgi:hypothetical protein
MKQKKLLLIYTVRVKTPVAQDDKSFLPSFFSKKRPLPFLSCRFGPVGP